MKRIRLTSIGFVAAALLLAALATSASAAPVFTKTFSFGVYGTEEGQIKSARGMDTDSKGNVWVADMEVSRIEQFSPTGQHLATITGSGVHKLKSPWDLAVAPDGNIWVMDSGLKAAVEFTPKGEYLREIGAGEGWLVAVDSKGNVWLGDPVGIPKEHVYKFNSEGVFQKEVKVPLYTNFEVDSKDNVLVSAVGPNGLAQYSSEGSYLGQIGKGVLSDPRQLTVDTEGNIWVVDNTVGGFVRGFNSKGEYLTQFDPGHHETSLYSIAPATEGNLWIAFSAVSGQIEKWTAYPIATTEAATGVTTSEATLNASVNPQGSATTYQFETSSGSGWIKAAPVKSVGEGTEAVKVNLKYTGLGPNQIYHFRVRAENSHGIVYGEDKWFNTGTHEWGLQASDEPSGSTGSMLEAVDCTGSETCAAVGFYWPGSGSKAMTKVETNGQWTLTSTPIPSEALYSSLTGVSCTASNACTAVGYATNSTGGSATPLAVRWDGSSWSIQSVSLPAGGKYGYLAGVDCTASNDCIAVGYYVAEGSSKSLTLAERWNGTSWSVMSTPNVEGATANELEKISCVSSSDCWAVGNVNKSGPALAEHWNGTSWSINSPASMPERLKDISCGSSSSCVATTAALGNQGLTLARWNGSTWSKETAATPPEVATSSGISLGAVSCTSASACLVTGRYRKVGGVIRELAESWNGSKWSVQSTSAPAVVEEATKSGPEADLTGGVSCTSATACTSVGFWAAEGFGVKSLVEVRH